MESYVEIWSGAGITIELKRRSQLFIEPKNQDLFKGNLDQYKGFLSNGQKAESATNAVMMGVCRGKMSEGLDFTDEQARCVIMVGMPFPQMNDANVILKKHYLDCKAKEEGSTFNGWKWYSQDTHRTVNQSIGRVIRHNRDYGVIILADERFAESKNSSKLPDWVRASLETFPSYNSLPARIESFMKLNQSQKD